MGRNTAVEFAFSLGDGFFIARPAGDSDAGGATATPALVAVREILGFLILKKWKQLDYLKVLDY